MICVFFIEIYIQYMVVLLLLVDPLPCGGRTLTRPKTKSDRDLRTYCTYVTQFFSFVFNPWKGETRLQYYEVWYGRSLRTRQGSHSHYCCCRLQSSTLYQRHGIVSTVSTKCDTTSLSHSSSLPLILPLHTCFTPSYQSPLQTRNETLLWNGILLSSARLYHPGRSSSPSS